MKNKLMAILIAISMVGIGLLAAPIGLASDITVTGTFTATGTLDVDVNRSACGFGSIAVTAHAHAKMQVQNNGNVYADVNHDQCVKDSGAMTIAANGSLGKDQYSVMMNITAAAATDVGMNDNTVIANGLANTAIQKYNLTVWVGPSLSAASHANEQFSADIVVAADT